MRGSQLAVIAAALTGLAVTGGGAGVASTPVRLARVPGGGVQPEVATDPTGVVHLVYLSGDPAASDVFYVRSSDSGVTFSRPVRVNSEPGSAVATGTIRGAQIAVGRNGRLHVSWNGSATSLPKAPVNSESAAAGAPMLYARSDPGGTRFEPQRNLITATTDLDGGGSIAVDDRAVYVAWHANAAGTQGDERARRVWIARSEDDGASFGKERPVSDAATGACGCCALRLFAGREGELDLLYRAATGLTERDIFSLVSRDGGRTFRGGRLHPWHVKSCPMTSMSIAAGPHGVVRAWETEGQVYLAANASGSQPVAPQPGDSPHASPRKHPRLAVNGTGVVLLLWTEGTAWARGGSLAWQAFRQDGRPTDVKGTQSGLPVWSFGATVSRPDGGFTILY
jgi:hypothetical protein